MWADDSSARVEIAHAPSPDVCLGRKPNRVSDGDLRGAPLGAAHAPSPDVCLARKPNRMSDGDLRGALLGAAHAPSPDVCLGLPGLGSLGCRLRFAILAALVDIRRLPGHGQPRASEAVFRPPGGRATENNPPGAWMFAAPSSARLEGGPLKTTRRGHGCPGGREADCPPGRRATGPRLHGPRWPCSRVFSR